MQNLYCLDRDELLTFSIERGAVITVEQGVVWLTDSGRDVVVSGGQDYTFQQDAEILAQGIEPTSLRLSEPQAYGRLWHRLIQLVVS